MTRQGTKIPPPHQPPVGNPEADWYGSALKDYHSIVALNNPGGVAPYQHLASGRYLHNPAKRRVKDPSRWADQQINNAISSSQDWLSGVQNPSRDPVQASIESEAKWRAAMQEAIQKNRRVEGLRKTSAAEIAAIATAKGTASYESGIRAREGKIREAVAARHQKAQAISDAIQAMPDATPADREKRLVAAMRLMRESKGQ